MKNKITLVTGLWDLGRGNIDEAFKRPYQDYLDKFADLLKTDIPMYIYIDPSDEEFIWKHRKKENTHLKFLTIEELKKWFCFTNKVNEIRIKSSWYSQADWLSKSPQATLEAYNPLVMSKFFMVNDARLSNVFDSEYYFWLDAGIANTVHPGYFYHDKVLDNLPDFLNANENFVFVTYPYIGGYEIHGFEREAIARYCDTDYVKYVCRGGFFGGHVSVIEQLNGVYYGYLDKTLSEGYMGTEESIFTIMMHNYSDIITQYSIEDNGLLWPFFEDLKDKKFDKNIIKSEVKKTKKSNNIALYALTFNSPDQFSKLCQSIKSYDGNLLSKTKKFLIDNSTDNSTYSEYKSLCEYYGFTHLKMKENLGICGGRQYIAKHADDNDFDYHMFFEDDMFFYNGNDVVCRDGFPRKINDFYNKILHIIANEKFDFLKFNFTEFYGSNSKQWAWYNVPQEFREKHFPERPHKTEDDTGKEPFAIYKNIKTYNGLAYATGEIYYCNWPQIVSKEGNKKMFLETTWAYPFEQTWMSHIYQETLKGKINPGILLATPTEHDRFFHYNASERKES